MQNEDRWEDYVGTLLEKGKLPLHRALPVTDHQRLIREMILQLKTGRIDAAYFRRKFRSDILTEFADAFHELEEKDILTVAADGVTVSPDGLLQIDRYLPTFFEAEHRGTRYT
jgi:coproporphyrinogen III oxidase-like Fe-S oxidoreductase